MSMRKFMRATEPDVLREHSEAWGQEWARKHGEEKTFAWPQKNGKPLNHILLPALKEQTQEHCSFCDAYPVSPPGTETIEHFRPKSVYHEDAFSWGNLYYCCNHCQKQKQEKFDEKLLRPDELGYRFDDYFRWDFISGHLLPNDAPNVSDENRERAKLTIKMYGLNVGHPEVRLNQLRKCPQPEIGRAHV